PRPGRMFGVTAERPKYTRLVTRYSRSGEMNETRRPSIQWRVSSPGLSSSVRNDSANFPSQPTSSETVSPASWRTVGFGGTARCPQLAQKAPVSGDSQLRHWTLHRFSEVGRPRTRRVDSAED